MIAHCAFISIRAFLRVPYSQILVEKVRDLFLKVSINSGKSFDPHTRYTNRTKRSSTRIITKTKSRLRIEGSWTSKAGKTEGKWPWTFPSKWVDITRRCRSSCYDKFLSKRTRLVTFPSWKCQLCVLPDFCYILKHFSRFFNHNDLNGWN